MKAKWLGLLAIAIVPTVAVAQNGAADGSLGMNTTNGSGDSGTGTIGERNLNGPGGAGAKDNLPGTTARRPTGGAGAQPGMNGGATGTGSTGSGANAP